MPRFSILVLLLFPTLVFAQKVKVKKGIIYLNKIERYRIVETGQRVHVHIKFGAYYAPEIAMGVFKDDYFDFIPFESVRPTKPWTFEVMATKQLKNRHKFRVGILYQSLPLKVGSYICGVAPPCEPFTQYYHLQYVGIPIHHGYRLLTSEKVNLTIYNGIQPTYSLENKEEELLQPWSFAIKSEFMFTYAINDKYGLSISPFCSQSLTSLHKEDKFRPLLFGAMMGFFIGADED